MSDPLNPPPSFAYRLLLGLFGLLLGFSTLVCSLGLLSIFRLGEGTSGDPATLFLVVAVFVPMVLVLAGATSALVVFAFTGRRGPMIHQGSLKALLIVLGALLGMVLVGSLLGRDWSTALSTLGLGVELLGIFLAGLVFERRAESRER